MTPQQLELIPTRVLFRTAELLEYLNARGLRLSLLELDNERRRRRPGQPHATTTKSAVLRKTH